MVLEGEAAKGLLRKAHVKLHEAWARSTVLNVPEIDERMNALNIALVIAEQDASFGEQDVNYWPLSIALRDVRKALAAFQRREPLPVKEFPPVDEVIALAHPKGRNVGLDGVRQELMNRAVL